MLSLHGNGYRFKPQLPVLAKALSRIAPCLLQHAQAAEASRVFRLECLLGLAWLTACSPEEVSKGLSESQPDGLVNLLVEVCAWPATDQLSMADWRLRPDTLCYTCARLLEVSPVSFSTADAFFTWLLPLANCKPTSLAIRTAIKYAMHVLGACFVQSCRDAANGQSAQLEPSHLIKAAYWQLPLLCSIPQDSNGLANTRVFECMRFLNAVFDFFLDKPCLLSDQELVTLLGAQRDLWQCARCCDDWRDAELMLRSLWQAGTEYSLRHGLFLLSTGWMPVPACRMDAFMLGAAAAGGCNAEVMLRVLAGQLEQLACTWWQVLCLVQLGMPHTVATEDGVRALLEAGLLKVMKQATAGCLRELILHDNIVCVLVALTAWYAERFPAVRNGIAAEHLVLHGAESQQGQAGPICNADGSCSYSRSSLWTMLQGVQRYESACMQLTGRAEPEDDDAGKGLPVSPEYCSRLSADEFAGLPVSKLRSALSTPPVYVSMRKLHRVVGQQIQVLQAHAAAARHPSSHAPASQTPELTAAIQYTQVPPAASGTGSSAWGSSSCAAEVPPAAAAVVGLATNAACQQAPGAESAGQVTPGSGATPPALALPGSSADGAGTSMDQQLVQKGGSVLAEPEPAATCVPGGSSSSVPACAVCNAMHKKEGGKLLLCAGCVFVRYFSSSCQKQHWKHGGHRAVCKRLQQKWQQRQRLTLTLTTAAASRERNACGADV